MRYAYGNQDGYIIDRGTELFYEVTTSRTVQNLTKTVNILESSIGGLENYYTKKQIDEMLKNVGAGYITVATEAEALDTTTIPIKEGQLIVVNEEV